MFTQHRRTWTQTVIRAVQAHGRKALAALTALATVAALILVAAPAHAEETRIADPTTFTQWEQGMGDPTDPRSTGRVWADKSVSTKPVTLKTYKGDTVTVTPEEGSFLVGLSAMSSAQKLIGVSNVTKPLDIVLVLDTSGSMAWGMDGNQNPGYSYQPVYADQLSTSESYYIPNGSNYREVSWSSRENSWGYGGRWNWTSVTPKTSADDADKNHVQFYTRAAASRMNALKQAVNGFIDQTIAANAKVSDANKKNRIGLVTYACDTVNNQCTQGTSIRSGLTDSLDDLKTTVNGLQANGATYADKGLEKANDVLENARADASKIVVFFTDGVPGYSSFEPDVANTAIVEAKAMKEANAAVYSVGIFEGANPDIDVSKVTDESEDELKANAFVQGVSSNYPNATAYTDLGTRAPDANYYLAASDADALNAVFDTIWGEVSSNPNSPIQTESQGGTTAGNGVVTFTDQLGDYMRVTRMNSIVFAGQQYETVSSQTSADGSQTTYTFEGKVEANEIYKEADLSTMQIVVTHSEGKTGDLVTVNVPAELLPLRLYTANVDKDGNVTTSINRTNPMRLFYEVNLKDGTEAKIAQPDEQMWQYLADPANIDADGSVRFLTNAYNTSTNGANGSTTAVFTPATTNDFYYFTQDTPLYNSESLDDPATSIEAGKTYYYQRTYYANNAKHEQWIDVLGANAEGKAIADADGHYYAPAGTVRTGLSRRYTAAKESNPTGTAANAIAPHWEMNNVTVNLGNNGLRKVARPGALEVTEIVEWTDGEMPQAVKDKAFPFTLALSGVGADGEYQAAIAGQNVTVKNGAQFSLKHGESIMVYGLPAGATAIVTQTDIGGKGWSVNHRAAEGSITAGETTQLGFVNQYTPAPVTLPEGSISGAKTLVKRDWQPDESFTFQIAAGDSNPEAPMPKQRTVTVTNPGGADAYQNGQRIPFAFGAITYTKPGTYQYVITEQGGGKPGMQYSGARYIATVTVTDNGDGTMSAAAVLTNTFGDDGVHIDGEPEAASADFTNTFVGENESVATIRGIKHYTDHTGSKPNNVVGTFNVMITPDEGNPANGPTFKSDVPVGVDGTWTRKLQFTNEALNGQHEQTFTYHVREIVPEGVGSGNPTKDGMTYDVNTYDVQITVSRDEQHNLITTVTYPDGGERVELTNSYRAQNTDAQALGVTKAVTGRDAEAGKFTFDATLRTNNAQYVKVEQPDGTLKDWATASVPTPAITKGKSADIDFGSLVFTMPGTYTFAVREQLPDGASAANPKVDGWTYDTHTHTVTYTVTDSNGKLKAAATTDGSATFTNAYTAQVNYGADGAMRIGKTLTGRAMNAQEFSFVITPIDGAPMTNGAQSVTTANPFSAVSGQELVWPVPGTLLADLTFTQDDIGKTYRYTIREVLPEGVTEDNPKKDGVTYDLADHTVSITVIDNGNGTLTTETKVDGQADGVAHFANTYTIAKGESAVGFAKAITGRDWKSGESFTFELTPNTGQSSVSESVLKAAMPKGASVTVGKPDSGRTAAFAFNGFTFSQPGTYVYNVREQGAGESEDGLTNDARTALVSFTVADKGDGTYSIGRLITGIDFEDGVNTFTNAYKAKEFSGVPAGLAFTKELKGTEWTADRAFEFTLEAVTDGAPLPEQATISVGKPAKGNKADFAFGSITYGKTGVYEYAVKEVQGDMPGVSYDAHSAKVTVTVIDDGNGQLKAEAVVSEGAFSNTYTAQQVAVGSADLGLSKQLTGIEWPADRSFEFTLEGKDGAPMPEGAQDGVLTKSVGKPDKGDTADFGFGDITFTKAGTYEYTVKETKGDMPGVSYDGHSAKVTVTVADNGKGQLEADVRTDGGKFVNAYTAKEFTGVPAGMAFSKELTGTAWPDNGVFTFTLTGKDGAPMPQGAQDGVFTQTVNKPAQGDKADFTFGDITYTKTGTYTYTVKELAGIMPGVAFDDHEATVTVTVTDNGNGQLEAKAVVDKADFVNTYTAKEFHGVPEGMAFSKELTGTEWTEGREFTFMIEAVDGAPAPEQPTVTVGKPGNGNTADFTFGALTFTKTGTYQYVVTERNDGQPGITYDDHKAHVTVTVTDNGLGHLVATAKVDGAKFTNAYRAQPFDGVPTSMAFSKQLTGVDWPEDRAFEFTLEGKDGAPMPAGATATVAKPAKGDAASFGFGAIRYEEPGVYEYTVKETKGDMPGVSYDGHSATVKVTVRDNGQGQLEATAVVTDAAFVNTYGTTPSDGVPEGMTFIKQLDGIEWPAGRAFEFTLEGVDGAPMPAKSTLQVAKPADGNAAVFDFGAITYTAEGEYRYKVRETKGDMPGVSYDSHVADVTVTVTDNKQGDLVATATVTGNVFVNEYTAEEFTGVPAGMAFSKELTGISWPEDREFEFTLEGKDESTPMPAETKATVGKPEQGAKADFMFGDITYTKTGTYEYTVKETKGDMPGVSYDTHTAKVTVTVTDNGKGQLEAKATVEGAKFTNSYNAKPFEGVPAGLKLAKQLTGIAWPEDREFEFTLEAATDGAPMPAETKAAASKPAEGDTAEFSFGAIRYEKPGVYEYTVKETRGTMPGVAYDYHTAHITVTVTDNGQGQLDATAKVTEGKFVNTYSAVPATGVPTDFTLTKRVEGMEWNADQKFEFTIQAQGGAPMPKNATVTVGKPANGDSATFDFGEIVFERAGVYRYTVTETAGSQPGMVYDGHTATITVDVADDGQGHLVTATTVVNGLFTNTYSTQTVAYPGVDVTEDLTGRAQAQGEFQFVVSGSADDMARAGYTTRAVTSPAYEFAAAASGETVTVPGLFTGLELTHSDVRAGKRFVYEVDQTGAQSGNGLTVDDQVYRVEIWATDNGDGTMRVHTSINGVESTDPTPVLPFHNVYATAPVTIGGDAQVRINARKTLHGRALADGEFRFVVRDAKGAQLAGGTNAASGAVNFDAIEFTDARLISDVRAGIATAHVDGTRTVYRYEVTVSELTDALPAGITALESGFAATLVITDNGQGKLEAAVEYPADADGTLGFVNQYGAASEVSLGLNGNKVLAVASGNNAPDITGKYTFTLSGSQGAPMPQKTTAVNDAAGAVDFGQITYTMANVFGEQEAKPEEPKADENADGSDDASDVEADDVTTREKTFTYTVTESGSVAGVANDASAQRTITVHVKDNGDGTLTVSKESAASGTDFTFTNTYGVRPTDPTSPTDTSVKGGVPLTKTLSGRDLKAGEFTFELIEAASGKVVGSAANTADGSVSLPGVVFEAPGSYAYLVRELAGTTGGVTYDSRVYAAVATVVDNGDGTLGVSWAVTEPAVGPVEAMVFENTYAAQPTSVQISAGKMLLGRDLKAGEFHFALAALDSAPMPQGTDEGVQTVANDEHGNAQFGVIDYAQAGEYRYTVSEVKGDAEGVTYDETEHAVAVRVADNGEGQLLATVDYGDGEQGVVFTNTYTKPEEPDTPDTPDQPKPNMPAPSTPAAPQYPASGTPTYRPYSYSTSSRPYTGTVAYTGADVALIVAVAAVLLAAGAALLTMARRRQ